MIQRILLLSILALISLTSIRSSSAIGLDQEEAQLLSDRKKAEDQNDQSAVAQIDAQLNDLKTFEENQNKPIFEVLADPENNIFAYVMRGSLVKPSNMPPELAQLVPAAPHAAWREASFDTVAQNLGSKIALLHPHVSHNGSSPMPIWTIDQKEVETAMAPADPSDPNSLPKIGVYVFPDNGQPMNGVIQVKGEEKK